MNLTNVDLLISELQKMAAAAQKEGETRRWSKLSTHVTELERWRDDGMKDVCPVDYKSLGVILTNDDLDQGFGEGGDEKLVKISETLEDEMQDADLL